MPIVTVPLTCQSFDQNGQPIGGATYRLTLNRTDKDASGNLIAPELITGKADANGVFVFNVFPNALGTTNSSYEITATNPDTRRRFIEGFIVVPNQPSVLGDLTLLLVAPGLPAVGGGSNGGVDAAAVRDRATHTGEDPAGSIPIASIAGFQAAVQAVPGFGAGVGGGVTALSVTAPLALGGSAAVPALSIVDASATVKGVMTPAQFTKLAGITAGATVNATDAALRDRSTHTGTQTAATISDFAAAVTAVTGSGTTTVISSDILTVPYAPIITLDFANRKNFKIALSGDVVIENPVNSAEGKEATIIFEQVAPGGFKATFGTRWTQEIDQPTVLSAAPRSIDILKTIDLGTLGIRRTSFLPGLGFTTTQPGPSDTPFLAYSFGGVAQKGAWYDTDLAYTRGIGNIDLTTTESAVETLIDRNDGDNNSVSTAFRPTFRIVNGYRTVRVYNPILIATGGSGDVGMTAQTGFTLVVALNFSNPRTMVFSDVNSAFNGRFLRWDHAGVNNDGIGDIQFSVGTGTNRVSLRSGPGAVLTAGAYQFPAAPIIIRVNHDPVQQMMYMEVNGVKSQISCPAFAPGSPSFALGGTIAQPDSEAEGGADLYFYMHVFNTLSASMHAELFAYAQQKVPKLTEAPPAPAPGGGTGYAWASRLTPYVAGTIKPNNVTQQSMDDHCTQQYNYWKSSLQVGLNGRYPPFGTGSRIDEVVSEGISYGMLIAVCFAGYDAGAKGIFDDIYNVARTHPAYNVVGNTGQALMEWKLSRVRTENAAYPHSIGGGWNAVDGDEDIAMALLMADRQWGSSGTINYKADAIKVIDAMRIRNWRRGDGTVASGGRYDITRMSDYMTGHFKAYRKASGNTFWDTVLLKSHELYGICQNTISPNAKLVVDFLMGIGTNNITEDTDHIGDASPNSDKYYWNSCRVPWRMGCDYVLTGDVRARTVGSRHVEFFSAKHGGNAGLIVGGYDKFGNVLPGLNANYNPASFVATVGPAACGEARFQSFLNSCWAATNNRRPQGYYETELGLLSAIVMSGNWWAPL